MKIEDITGLNPWWKNPGWEKEDRHLKKLASYDYVYERKEYIPKKKGVIVVYGPRQVGKTTWIKQLIAEKSKTEDPSNFLYLNAEMMQNRFELYEDIKTVEALYKPKYIFIDEINAIEDWERTIKALVDEGSFEEKYVVLTGSSSINIMKKAERLPGRMAEGQYKFRYYPLSFREIAGVYGIKAKTPEEAVANLDMLTPILYRYFIHGGFASAINTFHNKDQLGEGIFSIYSAWIDGALAKLKRSPETANLIMDGITNALTNEISWSSLAKGINHVTVGEYAEILRNMFVINYLEKSRRAKEGAPKNKKIYFIDPFLYWLSLFKSRKLHSVNLAELDSTTNGKLAEISAYAAITQHIDQKKQENDFDVRRYLHFEKDRSGETDFIVRFGKKSFKLECKFGNMEKEKPGTIYITKDVLGENKIPLAVFLMFPEESLHLLKL
jgi:predicted AAA+ superfamily ATPase